MIISHPVTKSTNPGIRGAGTAEEEGIGHIKQHLDSQAET